MDSYYVQNLKHLIDVQYLCLTNPQLLQLDEKFLTLMSSGVLRKSLFFRVWGSSRALMAHQVLFLTYI